MPIDGTRRVKALRSRRDWRSVPPSVLIKGQRGAHITPAIVVMSVSQLEELDLNGDHADGQEEEEDVEEKAEGVVTKSKKKRKKKKTAAAPSTTTNGENGVPKPLAGSTGSQKAPGKSSKSKKQTTPPSIPIKDLFPNNDFPAGQILEHPVVDSYVSSVPVSNTFLCFWLMQSNSYEPDD